MSNLKFIQVGDSFNAIGLNVVWVIIGLITIYAGIKNLLDKENPSRVGTAVFWCSFGIVCGFVFELLRRGQPEQCSIDGS